MSEGKKIVVLLVDDDPSMQRMVGLFVAGENIDLDIAGNGRAALKRMAEKSYDILITDMQMPLMDGFELIDRIRALEYDIPVIVISAFNHDEIHDQFHKIGAFDVIQKPFDSKVLKQVIQRAIGARAQ